MNKTDYWKRYDSIANQNGIGNPNSPSNEDTIRQDLLALCIPMGNDYFFQHADKTITVTRVSELPDQLPRFYDRRVTLFTLLKDHPKEITDLLEARGFEKS
jgi:hypothetical protein